MTWNILYPAIVSVLASPKIIANILLGHVPLRYGDDKRVFVLRRTDHVYHQRDSPVIRTMVHFKPVVIDWFRAACLLETVDFDISGFEN